ncbi:MAG: TetR/AcrR family transcriptional regulator [Solirubrobacterales bacterium]
MPVSDTIDPNFGRRRRSDFEQNRTSILAAADSVFTELGIGASVGTVSERAKVSPATVYRHFPNREALLHAVYVLRINAYAAAIEDAQQAEDPRIAFRDSVHAIVELQAGDRSFREILATRDDDPLEDRELLRFGVAFLDAIRRAREANVLRDGVREEDVMLLLIATEGIARPTGGQSPAALKRTVDLLLDGICQQRSSLGGEPLEYPQLIEVSRNGQAERRR